ncbi:MAG: hypothetical protein ABDH29_02600 [Aquificaceae bacterium]
MTPSGCRQWKSACEINYGYSLKVYKAGQGYREDQDSWSYW